MKVGHFHTINLTETDTREMDRLGIREWPGYVGAFTRDQANGAIPNGTSIVKVFKEEKDAHQIGARGTVLGSFLDNGRAAYFVEWDSDPGIAVLTIDKKIGVAK